jgi:hypothetical protein
MAFDMLYVDANSTEISLDAELTEKKLPRRAAITGLTGAFERTVAVRRFMAPPALC